MDDDGNRKIDLVEFKRGLRDYGGTQFYSILYTYDYIEAIPFWRLDPLAGSFGCNGTYKHVEQWQV